MTATSAILGVPKQVGRYAIYDPIATGGMATVHLGRLVGPVGFARTVAIKRLHPQYARDPEFVSMFLDEARLAARIQHPNVVPTIDVIATDGELLLVMEYVRGEALGRLIKAASKKHERLPPRIVAAIVTGALNGLHAAHEASDESGRMLGIVHRDISPQNIIVGMDGVARVLDFGVAKAEDRVQVTKDQKLKGKLLYMAPEQLEAGDVDRRTDVYAMAIVLFEALTGERMFPGEREAAQLLKVTRGEIRMPSAVSPELAPFDAIVRKGAAMHPADRYATAREMSRTLEAVVTAATSDIGEWVEAIAGTTILERTRRVAEIESVNRLGVEAVRTSLAEELERSRFDSSLPKVTDSSASMTRPMEKRSTRWVLAMGALLVFGAMSAVIFVLWKGRAAVRANDPSTPKTLETREPASAPRTPATSRALADDTATSVSSASSAAVVGAPLRRVSAPAPKTDCEQPYVVDSSGHMHFRKECLSK